VDFKQSNIMKQFIKLFIKNFSLISGGLSVAFLGSVAIIKSFNYLSNFAMEEPKTFIGIVVSIMVFFVSIVATLDDMKQNS